MTVTRSLTEGFFRKREQFGYEIYSIWIEVTVNMTTVMTIMSVYLP